MKNQYFADRNDFHKFDLVLELLEGMHLKRFVLGAMLTPDDGRSDGGFTNYGCGGRRQQLHALLTDCLDRQTRDLAPLPTLFQTLGFECLVVPDDGWADDRKSYFARFSPELLHNAVTLLDPDNGLEVNTGRGRKYVRYEEVRQVFERLGPDGVLIVYQHLPRQKRLAYRGRIATSLRERVNPSGVIALSPNNQVAFFVLAGDERRSDDLESLLKTYNTRVGLSWCERII
jgi:hypothetical protein